MDEKPSRAPSWIKWGGKWQAGGGVARDAGQEHYVGDASTGLPPSGHGIASAGENYLIPVDVEEPSTVELKQRHAGRATGGDHCCDP
jgi:hypothetical protein